MAATWRGWEAGGGEVRRMGRMKKGERGVWERGGDEGDEGDEGGSEKRKEGE